MENGKEAAFATVYNEGLTKREYFAGLAMQGWISCQHDGFTGDEFSIATRAVKCADALLAELENKKK